MRKRGFLPCLLNGTKGVMALFVICHLTVRFHSIHNDFMFIYLFILIDFSRQIAKWMPDKKIADIVEYYYFWKVRYPDVYKQWRNQQNNCRLSQVSLHSLSLSIYLVNCWVEL